MKMKFLVLVIIWIELITSSYSDGKAKPNIVIIMADDLGWNDVSFHGSSEFQTPNIDALAYDGVILNNFNAFSMCTPSRSALMTGKFPIFTGMHSGVILEPEPWGLPLDLKIIPQYLKRAGYKTNLIGKWHLGFFEREYTPNWRGFDTFYGYWQGHQDYYSHYVHETLGTFYGYDMRRNMSVDWKAMNKYTTDLLTEEAVQIINAHDDKNPLFLLVSQLAPHAGEQNNPYQAPADEIEKFSYIKDPFRRVYAAMVSKLDESVGRIIAALNSNDMLENSIIIFLSDNGAPTVGIHANSGSNHPLRGMKASEWEGGTRVPAVIWSPLLSSRRISNMPMHIVDILPTLYEAAGMNPYDLSGIDGISMWRSLVSAIDQPRRTEFPYNIDPADESNARGAVRVGNWKYIQGVQRDGIFNTWLGKTSQRRFPAGNYVSKIKNSIAGMVFNKFYSEKLLEGSSVCKGKICSPLTSEDILQLRSNATVSCSESRTIARCSGNESCLINLAQDPCEQYNLMNEYPDKYHFMKSKFEEYRRKVVKPLNKPRDESADPSIWGGVWMNWRDFTHPSQSSFCIVSDSEQRSRPIHLFMLQHHYFFNDVQNAIPRL